MFNQPRRFIASLAWELRRIKSPYGYDSGVVFMYGVVEVILSALYGFSGVVLAWGRRTEVSELL